MLETCTECPKRATCTALCPKIEKMLPRDVPARERTASELLRKSEDEDTNDVPDIDKIRKIDRAAGFGDEEDQESVWDLASDLTAPDSTDEDKKVFRMLIDKGIPSGQTRLKRRFYSFLRCEKITEIALRANTTKQNIQKVFQRIIERAAAKHWKREAIQATPKKFKAMIGGWD